MGIERGRGRGEIRGQLANARFRCHQFRGERRCSAPRGRLILRNGGVLDWVGRERWRRFLQLWLFDLNRFFFYFIFHGLMIYRKFFDSIQIVVMNIPLTNGNYGFLINHILRATLYLE